MELEGKIDVLSHVLSSFYNITQTKTSEAHALLTIQIILDDLKKTNEIPTYIQLIDPNQTALTPIAEFTKLNNGIVAKVLPGIDMFSIKQLGTFIQAFSDKLFESMGKKAGYHFLKEFRVNIGEYYYNKLKEMGVDLRLSELQQEIYGWNDNGLYGIRESFSNIAFIEKKTKP